jgi:hypothetical protein
MSKKMGLYLSVALASAVTCGMLSPVQADSNGVVAAERVIWNSSPKSTAWVEELIGQVVTYQTLAEKRLIPGNYQPYLNHLIKVRNSYRAGDRNATYEGVNQFMTMLEARVGELDGHSADALWEFCYRVTPDEYHARDRHVRAKGEAGVKQAEQFMRDMEERASMSF